MKAVTKLQCACGQTRLEVEGSPITSVECCCTSCREAGDRIQRLAGAGAVLTSYGATPFVMYRKDRVRIVAGEEGLRSFRLSDKSSTQRVIASCCNSAVYVELKGGHWFSLYGTLWPAGTRPPLAMRTMASDLPDGAILPDDVPNASKHSLKFYGQLLGAWAAMGFRTPKSPQPDEMEV